MMPGVSPGGHAAPLLISMAVGYGVLLLARREARPLNRVGKFVGWLIIVVSFVGLLCVAASGLCRMCPRGSDMCPFGKPRSACLMPPEATVPMPDSERGGQ
jgi:hypothetical protein